MERRELYIETWVDGDAEDLWTLTQDPDEHERWDLRFSEIEYRPRPDESEPQRFTYRTNIGFGIAVSGGGESTGERADGGERTSALRFWSDDPKSLIAEGTGYWKYLPADGGVRFLTAYNYETRFGRFGRVFDRFVFRPLMVWATAWSFDCLRRWIESDTAPEVSLRQAVVHGTARLGLVLVWLYNGLVPKLLFPHPREFELVRGALPALVPVELAVPATGVVEVAMGLSLLAFWRRRELFPVSALLTVGVVGGGLLSNPGLLAHPLSPLSVGIPMLALALVGYVTGTDLPSATNCITDQSESEVS